MKLCLRLNRVLCGLAMCWGVATASAAELGVYLGADCIGASRIAPYAAWLGRKPDRALDFFAADSWATLIKSATRNSRCWAPTGLAMTFSVPMLPGDQVSNLEAGARGDYDEHFRAIAQALVAEGYAQAIVRLGWEFNYGWYPWAAAKNPQAWVQYWRRIVMVMRAVPGVKFRFDWCASAGWGQLRTDAVYPGDDYVDIIGMDVYNQTWQPQPLTPAQAWNEQVTRSYGLQWHKDFAAAHGKVMSYPEWGTGTRPDGHGRGDDPHFINMMAAWIKQNPVVYHDYWDYAAPDFNAKLSDGSMAQSGAAFRAAFH